MKIDKFLTYAVMAFLPLSLLSCSQEEYVPGEPDLDGCYGVYFPTQSNASDIELSPDDPKELTFTVKRLNDTGAITVPYTISGSDVFSATELKFEDGQTETTMTVSFPDIKNAVKYSCSIDISDPAYSLIYSNESHTLQFSVTVVEWNQIGTAKWRDDVIGSFLSIQNPYAEVACPISERSDKPGYYRLDKVYTAKFFSLLFTGSEANESQFNSFCYDSPIYVDATNPSKVYIVKSKPGLNLGSGLGDMTLASQVAENGFDPGEAYAQNVDGVIEFPSGGVMVSLTGYNNGTWFSVNSAGKLRLLLPGARVYDYDVSVSAGLASYGNLPLSFKFGADVANVKYVICEGRLNETEVAAKSQEIDEGKLDNVNTVGESSDFTVTCPATGVYTLVTANYDALATYRGYTSVTFTYLANGDDSKTVVINADVIISNRLSSQGYTSENSLEYFVSGKDIVEAYIGLFRMDDLKNLTMEDIWQTMQQNPAGYRLSDSQVAEINNSSFGGVVGNLTPGTEYNMIIVASNGYERRAFNNQCKTEGERNILYESIKDDQLNPSSDISDYYGEWDYYAVDLFGKSGKREKIGNATISQTGFVDGHAETYKSFVKVSGLLGPAVEKLGVKNEVYFGYYAGFLFPLVTEYGKADYYGVEVYPVTLYITDQGYALPGDGLLLGGFLSEGGIAFAEFGAASYGYGNFIGWGLGLFGDATISYQQLSLQSGYSDILLLTPEQSASLPSGTSSSGVQDDELRQLAASYSVPSNYVETPFGRFQSLVDEMLANRGPRNFMENGTRRTFRSEIMTVPVQISASHAGSSVWTEGPVTFTLKK